MGVVSETDGMQGGKQGGSHDGRKNMEPDWVMQVSKKAGPKI